MVLILTLSICNGYPKQSSKCRSKGQRMEQKILQILMKDNEQKTIHSLRFTGKLEQNKNNQGLNQYKQISIQVWKTQMYCN